MSDGTGAAVGAAGAAWERGGTLLVVCRPELSEEEVVHLGRLVAGMPAAFRWARRAGRLVLVLQDVPRACAPLGELVRDPAVEYVLADPPREEIDRLVSRRDLVKVALVTTGALAAACAAAPLALFLRPPSHERSPRGDVLLADIETIPVGGAQARVVDGEDLIVIRRDATHLHALSATCTHSEICLVEWDPRRGQLVCPCHRGVYDIYGNVVSGPPPRPLARRDVVLRDGHAWLRRVPS